jgi:hypothetical protein
MLRAEKINLFYVRAGFYRCNEFCIHRNRKAWSVYRGPDLQKTFRSLATAYHWITRQ